MGTGIGTSPDYTVADSTKNGHHKMLKVLPTTQECHLYILRGDETVKDLSRSLRGCSSMAGKPELGRTSSLEAGMDCGINTSFRPCKVMYQCTEIVPQFAFPVNPNSGFFNMRSSTPSPLAAFMLFASSVLCQNPTTTTINLGCYTSTGITSQKSVPVVVYTSTVTVTTALPKITVTKVTSTSTATTISTITPSIASTATWTITPPPVTVTSTSLVTALGATTTTTITPGWDRLKRHPAPTPAAPLFPRAHAIDRRGGFPQTVYCGAEVYVRTTKTITSVTHTAVSYATTTSTFTATINEVVSTQTITPAISTISSTVTVASTVVSTCFEGEKTTVCIHILNLYPSRLE
ncbi:hypothetical protein HO133_000150 [Letharia lupina]|uniref:Uncharacterized protein n=1 Tax=Letharia lupina TaxID=560253 RepID=A0A8H6FCZ0_9LECA|nr:uncharacterized protein HO133_000150 [Letharia lupina]KAF6223308.1 hypothetical protein HO133_000150 [Letharia lupina]